MKKFLFSNNKEFISNFENFLEARSTIDFNIKNLVDEVIQTVKKNGDRALIEYTKKYDQVDLDKVGFLINKTQVQNSLKKCDQNDRKAIKVAIERIIDFHKKQMPKDTFWTDAVGVELGWMWKPLERVGVYVPGGKASYPSTAIMNIVPARVAGVQEIALSSPTPKGLFNPLMIFAAYSLNVHEIIRLGGAQAIAALALGSETIKKVNKITGPGNKYVTEAKRQLFGRVGIDSVAGPSEVLIICDKSMPAKLAAIDLLSQAEHDDNAQSILITNDEKHALEVEKEVDFYLKKLKRCDIAQSSWNRFGAIVIVPSFEKAIEISNIVAPEHLQLCFNGAEKYLSKIKNAGSVFVGNWSPEAMGDYITGSNHVLPTNGTSKFSSSLSVFDFMKRVSITKVDKSGFQKLAPHVIRLADSEGLEAHSLSVSERLKEFE